jgi:hypothetical protein
MVKSYHKGAFTSMTHELVAYFHHDCFFFFFLVLCVLCHLSFSGEMFLEPPKKGGDFGKRELSPALRNRFTEVWVPAISGTEDIRLILQELVKKKSAKGKV